MIKEFKEFFGKKEFIVAPEMKVAQSVGRVNRKIQEIHDSFDIASQLALDEANRILNRDVDRKNDEKVKMLSQLGFNASPMIEKVNKERNITNTAKLRTETVQKYAHKYPQYKFIFRDQVEQICKKYSLICGHVGLYIGDVPMKNLKEIADFKVKDEDIYWHIYNFMSARNTFDMNGSYISHADKMRTESKVVADQHNMYWRNKYRQVCEKMPFFICAPQKDMKETKRKGVFAVEHIPDPIVLHFMPEGFLVVSKWGLEAEDAVLTNEKMN